MKAIAIVFLIVQLLLPRIAGAQIVSTIAGTGTAGYNRDGIQATAAQLNAPGAIARDKFGNVYIADIQGFRVRKVNTSGIISTIAGNGISGYTGDNGPATGAKIGLIVGLAIDAAGNLFLADGTNYIIRKISTVGIITTIAGTGVIGNGGDNGPANLAQFSGPTDIAIDTSGNLYITDPADEKVRKINTAGIITTFAGTGVSGFTGDHGPATSAQLNFPLAVATDLLGNVYVADANNHRIRKIDANGIISTIAGTGSPAFGGDGGPATAAYFGLVGGLSTDRYGNLYLCANYNVRKINKSGLITTIAGTGTLGISPDGGLATSTQFFTPVRVVLDSMSNIYMAELNNNKVRYITTTVGVQDLSGRDIQIRYFPNPTKDGKFSLIAGSLIDENIEVEVVNALGQRIRQISAITNKKTEITMDVPPGIYFISVTSAHCMSWNKIIVQ